MFNTTIVLFLDAIIFWAPSVWFIWRMYKSRGIITDYRKEKIQNTTTNALEASSIISGNPGGIIAVEVIKHAPSKGIMGGLIFLLILMNTVVSWALIIGEVQWQDMWILPLFYLPITLIVLIFRRHK